METASKMFDLMKALVVVLALALVMFFFAKRLCLQYMSAQDFSRRRNVWLALTTAGFLAPNLWIYAAVAMPLVFWAASVDRHPAALYMLLFVTIPPASIPIPLPLVNQLFELSPIRILALALLVPTALRMAQAGRRPGIAKADAALLAFGLLQLVQYMPYESITNTMRRAVLFGVDTYALYYVFSRGTADRAAMRDTIANFCLACVVLAPIVVFEAARGWLLYTNIPGRWGVPNSLSWLLRDGVLRAQGPAGHSLTMGILLALAFGAWLYLGTRFSKTVLWFVGLVIWAGLLATFSRAPWLVAAAVMLLYVVLSPVGRRHLFAIGVGVAVLLGGASVTRFGARLIDSLPFIGHSEQGNVDYRQQLAEISWRLIKQHPFFGDPFATRYMEDLRQGQGIIDIVNTYASIGVFYGLVGVALFVACYLYPMAKSSRAMKLAPSEDDKNLGAFLIAAIAGVLLMMATASFGGGFEQISWVLAGLCSAYPAAVMQALPTAARAAVQRVSSIRVASGPLGR